MKALLAVRSVRDDYAPWEKFRFRKPPEGLTVQQWWLVTAFERSGQQRDLSLHDVAGRPFRFALPDVVLRLADSVSNRAGGHIGLSEPVTNPATRETYVVRSLMEESITSSQLEGAVTTRRVAKEMLRSGRPPRDHSEQMIWTNYQAMQLVGEQRGAPLTPALVRELHAIVTLETLQDPADGGRTQAPGDDRGRRTLLHPPGPAHAWAQPAGAFTGGGLFRREAAQRQAGLQVATSAVGVDVLRPQRGALAVEQLLAGEFAQVNHPAPGYVLAAHFVAVPGQLLRPQGVAQGFGLILAERPGLQALGFGGGRGRGRSGGCF